MTQLPKARSRDTRRPPRYVDPSEWRLWLAEAGAAKLASRVHAVLKAQSACEKLTKWAEYGPSHQISFMNACHTAARALHFSLPRDLRRAVEIRNRIGHDDEGESQEAADIDLPTFDAELVVTVQRELYYRLDIALFPSAPPTSPATVESTVRSVVTTPVSVAPATARVDEAAGEPRPLRSEAAADVRDKPARPTAPEQERSTGVPSAPPPAHVMPVPAESGVDVPGPPRSPEHRTSSILHSQETGVVGGTEAPEEPAQAALMRFRQEHHRGVVVEGTICAINSTGIVVRLAASVHGTITAKDLSRLPPYAPELTASVGDSISVAIGRYKATRNILLLNVTDKHRFGGQTAPQSSSQRDLDDVLPISDRLHERPPAVDRGARSPRDSLESSESGVRGGAARCPSAAIERHSDPATPVTMPDLGSIICGSVVSDRSWPALVRLENGIVGEFRDDRLWPAGKAPPLLVVGRRDRVPILSEPDRNLDVIEFGDPSRAIQWILESIEPYFPGATRDGIFSVEGVIKDGSRMLLRRAAGARPVGYFMRGACSLEFSHTGFVLVGSGMRFGPAGRRWEAGTYLGAWSEVAHLAYAGDTWILAGDRGAIAVSAPDTLDWERRNEDRW